MDVRSTFVKAPGAPRIAPRPQDWDSEPEATKSKPGATKFKSGATKSKPAATKTKSSTTQMPFLPRIYFFNGLKVDSGREA
jgi:hypothetical protein